MAKIHRLLGEFALCKLLVEFVNPSSSIDKLHLTGEERMRTVGDFQLDEWILLAIFPGNGVFRSSTAASQEGFIGGKILENDKTVILWMDIFFHDQVTWIC